MRKYVRRVYKKLQPYVISMFKIDLSGHDINHLIRTMNRALYIQEREGGDRVIIRIAAFLHDIYNNGKRDGAFCFTKDSIPKIKEILSNINLDEEQVNEICFCIENHENYNWYSVIYHFYRKLFKLGDNMNTKTAKDIATKRIDFMKNFTEEFLNEWNSKI